MFLTKQSRTKKIFWVIALVLCLCMLPTLSYAETTNSIDEGIHNLQYDKDEVLAHEGDIIENIIPREGIHKDGKFIVIEREKKSLGTTPVDISIVDAIVDRTYPSSLLLADENLANNRPTALVASRDPITVSIDLPGLGSQNSKVVDNPTYSNVSAAIQELINNWYDQNGQTHSIPARTQYSESMVYSRNQLQMGLNIDVNIADQLLGIDFESIHNGEQKYMVAAYKQIFYTVSAELPKNPSDLFSDSVTFRKLKRKGVSEEAPPVMVSNVAYGRTIYVVLKTSSKSDKVEAAFRALIQGQSIEGNLEYEQIIENSSFSVVILGGDAGAHNQIITNDFEKIRTVIKDNAEFSIQNPGYPISYTCTFIKDNALAAIHNATDYVEITTTEYSQGRIMLEHSGAFVAQFNVAWDEVEYDEVGNEVLTHIVWEGSDKDLTAHYSTLINLKPNTKNIRIKAKECTGLAWEWWRKVVDEVNMPLSNKIKVKIYGSTLHPAYSVEY